ncbi:hypothetical protein [Acuticoccus sediminis]|uniref:hypothetical protein n=1 Tax=Acuticoccus sediminis TaxID=2184697 RepID=UPI001CFF46D6|nr:hypothetical protein [Acuticoccus sediminis]
MPKVIDVKLNSIHCAFNGFGGSILLNGAIAGTTFMSDPNNPADAKETKKIYPFPSGPISISQDETVEIQMLNSVSFALSTPTTEPGTLNPKYLKLGGELNNGLGSQFFTLDYLVQLPITGSPGATPALKILPYSASNLRIDLIFAITMQNPF